MMPERGLNINHTTIYRWVLEYYPELNRGLRKYLKPTAGRNARPSIPGDSWSVDETYIKLNGKWMYLYRAVDQYGNTIDFWLSRKRDRKAAKKFLRKALRSPHNTNPRVITTDKYAATIKTIKNEINNKRIHPDTKHWSSKYMNNIIEQYHRRIKCITNHMLGFRHFKSACAAIHSVEAMSMIRKGQANTKTVFEDISLINVIFNVA